MSSPFYRLIFSYWLFKSAKSLLSWTKVASLTYFSLANCSFNFVDDFSNTIWNYFCSFYVFYLIFNSCSATEIDASYLVALVVNLPLTISGFGLDTVLPARRGLSSSSFKDLNLVLGFSGSSLGLKTLLVFLYCYCLRTVIWAYCYWMDFSNYLICIVLA